MPPADVILKMVGVFAMAIALVVVIQWRRKSQRRFLEEFSDVNVCEHLQGALEVLKGRGHVVVRAGQKHPDLPLEIHISPRFDPAAIAAELKLEEPVFVSERGVLYCKEDWCELHPRD